MTRGFSDFKPQAAAKSPQEIDPIKIERITGLVATFVEILTSLYTVHNRLDNLRAITVKLVRNFNMRYLFWKIT
uniref:Uncharacterized protein n=1 Tax=Schistosoma japonicum TaxID=6182 RepID=Q5BYB1_SCHJA|nr:unknown [Schistosoma japonicum]